MTDLKLIDELLIELKPPDQSWKNFERHHSSTVAEAMQRLREACKSGELELITLSLATHFGLWSWGKGVVGELERMRGE